MEIKNSEDKAAIGIMLDAAIPAEKQLMDWIDANDWNECSMTFAFSDNTRMGLTIRPSDKPNAERQGKQ